jgi:hypothetical protein
MKKVIESHMSRKFTVENYWQDDVVHLGAENTASGSEIISRLAKDTAVELGEALINAAQKGVFVYDGRLPLIRDGKNGQGFYDAETRTTRYASDSTPESLMREIKVLISIRNELIKEEAEREERRAEKAAAALKLQGRRNELTRKFAGREEAAYANLSGTAQKAIDYIIEMEDRLAEDD